MKLLFIHSDYLEYNVTEAVKGIAEPIDDTVKGGRMENALVVFTAVEKGDLQGLNDLLKQTIGEIMKTAATLKVKGVVLYPYAHLSSNLAPPHEAVKVIKAIDKKLRESDLDVMRSPFGWYKAFGLYCKGHPLAEMYREY